MSLNSNMAISNCDMSLIKKTNEMVVSYTSIGANTYNIMVFDMNARRIRFNFEIYSLSEDRTMGFLLATNDFLIMNQQGIQMISMSDEEGRQVNDNLGMPRFVHALGGSDFLKIEETNNILFSMTNYYDRQIIV